MVTSEETKSQDSRTAAAAGPVGADASQKGRTVREYDFRRPQHLSAEQMRSMQHIHAAVAETLQNRLSRYFGVSIEVALESVEEMAYGLLLDGLAEHIYTNMLDLSPLEDKGLLILDTQLCLAFVDHILGGQCKTPPSARPLTAIDQVAVENAIEIILRCIRTGWKDYCDVKLTVVERRNDPHQVHYWAKSEPMLVASIVITGELGEGRLRLCMPVARLKASVDGLAQRTAALGANRERAKAIRLALLHSLERAALPVTASIGAVEIPIRNLMKLHVADVVRLDGPAESPITLEIGGRAAFRVKMGLKGRHKAVQIVERIGTTKED